MQLKYVSIQLYLTNPKQSSKHTIFENNKTARNKGGFRIVPALDLICSHRIMLKKCALKQHDLNRKMINNYLNNQIIIMQAFL